MEPRRGDAQWQLRALQRGDDRLPLFQVRHRDHAGPRRARPSPDVSDSLQDRDKKTRRAASTVRQGHHAIDPESWGPPYVLQDDQDNPRPAQSRGPLVCNEEGFLVSAGTAGTILVNPEDASDLQPLPN